MTLDIDPGIIENRFKWYQFQQYVVAIFMTLLIPYTIVHLCYVFETSLQTHLWAGGALLLNCIILWVSPRVIWEIIKANPKKFKPVTPETLPEFYEQMKCLAARAEMNLPQIFMVDSPTPNAFALKTPDGYIACITQGLYDLLDSKKRKGVMAHEFGHIKYNDITLIMYVAVLNILNQITRRFVMDVIIKRGLQKTEEQKTIRRVSRISTAVPSLAFFWTVGFAYKILMYFPYLVTILFTRVTQQKEYRADAFAAYVLEDTEPIKQGLITLHKYARKVPIFPTSLDALFRRPPLNPLFAVPVARHFWINLLVWVWPSFRANKDALKPPTWQKRFKNLFQSHPLTYDRIERLKSYEKTN